MREPEVIEIDLMRADSVELLKFYWMEYYDSAKYDKRRNPNEVSEFGHRMNELEMELRKQGKFLNQAGDCGTCHRPRQACMCDPEFM